MKMLKLVASLLITVSLFFGCNGNPTAKNPLEEKYSGLGISAEGTETTVEESVEIISNLIGAGLIEGEDFTVEINGDRVVITITEKGKIKIENQVKVDSGEIKGETITIDLIENSFISKFYYSEKDGKYGASFPIGDVQALKLGDKLDVTLKASISKDVSDIEVGVFYSENGDIIFVNSSNLVKQNMEIEANESFEVSFTQTVNKVDISADKDLFLEVKYSAEKDDTITTYLENNASSEDSHIKVSSTNSGIIIELKTVAGETKKDYAGPWTSFVINGKNAEAAVIPDALGNDREGKSYVFPFVAKDDVIYVEYWDAYKKVDGSEYEKSEVVKIKSEYDCLYLSDYVNLDKYKTIKPKLRYNNQNAKFYFGFTTEATSDKDFFTSLIPVENFGIDISLKAGALDWTATDWIAGSSYSIKDGVLCVYNDNYENIPFFENALQSNVPFAPWTSASDVLNKIAKRNNQYWASFRYNFKLGDYTYQLSEIKTELYTFEQGKNAVESVETSLTDAIANVKTIPTTEAEALQVLDDVITEYVNFFGGMNGSAQRAVVQTGKEALKAIEIVEQVKSFMNEFLEKYIDVSEKINNSKINQIVIDFDKQLNIGKVAFSEWYAAICDIYNEIMNEMSSESYVQPLTDVICDEMEITSGEFFKYIALLDEYAAVEKLYLDLDVDVNTQYLDIQNPNTMSSNSTADLGSAYVGYIGSYGVININALIKEIFNNMNMGVTLDNVSLPLKAIQINFESEADVKATYGDLVSVITASSSGDFSNISISKADVAAAMDYKIAVCTKENKGGIFTCGYKLKASADDVKTIISDITTAMQNPSESNISYLDDYISYTISFSNGETESFSKEYKYSEFITLGFIQEYTLLINGIMNS